MTEFDPLAHARAKARRYEAEAIALRQMNDKLFRLIALLLDVAAADSTIEQKLDLLAVADELEEMVAREVA